MGRPMHPRTGQEYVLRSMEIRATEPFKYTIDGDMHLCESGQLTVEAGPRLTIIRK